MAAAFGPRGPMAGKPWPRTSPTGCLPTAGRPSGESREPEKALLLAPRRELPNDDVRDGWLRLPPQPPRGCAEARDAGADEPAITARRAAIVAYRFRRVIGSRG